MDNDISAVYEIQRKIENLVPPTRQCLICNCLENELAKTINGATWLCPNCKMKIKALFLIHNLIVEEKHD